MRVGAFKRKDQHRSRRKGKHYFSNSLSGKKTSLSTIALVDDDQAATAVAAALAEAVTVRCADAAPGRMRRAIDEILGESDRPNGARRPHRTEVRALRRSRPLGTDARERRLRDARWRCGMLGGRCR